jgi:hypothetical protein
MFWAIKSGDYRLYLRGTQILIFECNHEEEYDKSSSFFESVPGRLAQSSCPFAGGNRYPVRGVSDAR